MKHFYSLAAVMVAMLASSVSFAQGPPSGPPGPEYVVDITEYASGTGNTNNAARVDAQAQISFVQAGFEDDYPEPRYRVETPVITDEDYTGTPPTVACVLEYNLKVVDKGVWTSDYKTMIPVDVDNWTLDGPPVQCLDYAAAIAEQIDLDSKQDEWDDATAEVIVDYAGTPVKINGVYIANCSWHLKWTKDQ